MIATILPRLIEYLESHALEELCDLLAKYGYTDKNSNGSVSETEFNVIMGALTASNQIVHINDYFIGKTHIIVETEERVQKREEEARIAREKAEAERLAKEKAEAERLAAEKAAAEKAEAELDKKLTEYLKSLQNQNSSQVVADGEYLWPLPKGQGWITCKFGGSDPNNKPHYALDVAIAAGTPIYATNAGTVLISGWHSSYGYYILIDHGNGMASLYAHCSALLVKAGQTVSRGQTIGKVGTTGFSKGNHLHFEIRKNGVRVDPLAYMAPQAPENIL